MIGDFNCTLSSHERRGGVCSQPHRDMDMFRSVLQECDLIDAGFQGEPYTWKKGNVEVRLDRCLINLPWRLKFPEVVPLLNRIIDLFFYAFKERK